MTMSEKHKGAELGSCWRLWAKFAALAGRFWYSIQTPDWSRGARRAESVVADGVNT